MYSSNYIHIHVCAKMYLCTPIHIYIYVYGLYSYRYMYNHIYIYMRVCIRVRAYVYTHTHVVVILFAAAGIFPDEDRLGRLRGSWNKTWLTSESSQKVKLCTSI